MKKIIQLIILFNILLSQSSSATNPDIEAIVFDFDCTITKSPYNEYFDWTENDTLEFKNLIETLRVKNIKVAIASASSKARINKFFITLWGTEDHPFKENIYTPEDIDSDWTGWEDAGDLQNYIVASYKGNMLDRIKEKFNIKNESSMLLIDDNSFNCDYLGLLGYLNSLFPSCAGTKALTELVDEILKKDSE